MIWIEEHASYASLAIAITCWLLIVIDDRRWLLVTMAIQYFFVTWLVGLTLPIQIAFIKVVAGLASCGIMALSISNVGWEFRVDKSRALPSGRPFRLIASLLVLITSTNLGRANWMSLPALSSEAIMGSTILMSFGLLQLGLSEEPTRVGIGLLTLLAGFEVAYSSVEPSLAVLALLAVVHVGMAVVIGYLLMLQVSESDSPEVSL